MSEQVTVDGHSYDGYCVIQHARAECGFFALVSTVLNTIRYALRDNLLPVVNLDAEVSDYYFDAERGTNIWAYFFEPVMGLSYEDLSQQMERGEVDPSQVLVLKDRRRVDD